MCQKRKLDNLEKMKIVLETYSIPRLNQEETNSLNRPITTTEIKSGIKNLSTDKCSGLHIFTGKFY